MGGNGSGDVVDLEAIVAAPRQAVKHAPAFGGIHAFIQVFHFIVQIVDGDGLCRFWVPGLGS